MAFLTRIIMYVSQTHQTDCAERFVSRSGTRARRQRRLRQVSNMSGEKVRYLATQGDYDQLMLLLTAGGNPCSVNEDGLTALHLAVWNGHVKCVEALCANSVGKNSYGVQESCLNYRSSGGFTALHIAVMGALEPLETIPILLRSGVDPDLKDRLGRTPLDLASQYKLSEDVLDALKDIPMDAEGIASYCENIRERHPLIRSRYSDSQEEEKNELFVEKYPREPPRPRELKIGELRIKPSFEKCCAARRSAKVVKAIKFLSEQAIINDKRRRKLADLAQKAENEWRSCNPKALPPERHLFMSKWKKVEKERKYRLVPIISFSDDAAT